jgi:hypothetical protein
MNLLGTVMIEKILLNLFSTLVVTRRCFESRRDRRLNNLMIMSSSCFFIFKISFRMSTYTSTVISLLQLPNRFRFAQRLRENTSLRLWQAGR